MSKLKRAVSKPRAARMPGGANGKGASGEPRVQAINAAPRAAPAAATALQQEGCYV
jgi:hypothetical protein